MFRFMAIMAASMLIPLSAEAALIRATIEGTVDSNSGITQFMNGGNGSSFTLLFDFEDSTPDTRTSGSAIARFAAVQGAQVDGFSLTQSGSNNISYLRQSTRDFATVEFGGYAGGTGITGDFSGTFPMNHWGGGPYTADQLSAIEFIDFISAPNVSFFDHVTSGVASGDVTSISFAPASSGNAVPEPSSAILLAMAAGVGAILYRRKRKALELQSAANSVNA